MVEPQIKAFNGFVSVLIGISVIGFLAAVMPQSMAFLTVLSIILIIISLLCGGNIIQPNQGRIFLFFGKYIGSLNTPGFFWVCPLFTSKSISLRVKASHSAQLKMNDKKGNPIEIAAILVWHVNDPYKALLQVEDHESYVTTQIESALRHLASHYPYENAEEEFKSLRCGGELITKEFQTELEARMELAGIKVVEARISHLAYAPEIAGAMLQKQQAEAMIAAREKIVEGAIGMVRSALTSLDTQELSYFSEGQKASLVSNLLVTLCSDRGASPVINISADS